jgi:hypothetical protein
MHVSANQRAISAAGELRRSPMIDRRLFKGALQVLVLATERLMEGFVANYSIANLLFKASRTRHKD